MIYKPQIEVDWSPVDDPMKVSLGGLQKIIFSPPFDLLNQDFSSDFETPSDPKFKVRLSSPQEVRVLFPKIDEIREVKARSDTYSRDLFWTLFSGHDLLALRAPSPILKRLAESLEFHFQNGENLSLIGIFRKPGLPKFLNPYFYLKEHALKGVSSWTDLSEFAMKPLRVFDYQKRNDDFKKAWLVILEIVSWAIERKNQIQDLEVLWSGDRTSCLGYSLSGIELSENRPTIATVMSEMGPQNRARIIQWQGVGATSSPGVLQFYSVAAMKEFGLSEQVEIEVTHEELAALPLLAQFKRWKPCSEARYFNSRELTQALNQLEKTLSKTKILYIKCARVTASALTPVFRVREVEHSIHVSVSFKMDLLEIHQVNFASSLLPAMKPFLGGIDTFFNLDRKEVASEDPRFRSLDLMFLRHQGVTLFCLLEILNWILQRPLSSGEKIDYIEDIHCPAAGRQFDQLLNYLKDAIPGLLGKAGKSFSSLFSSEVKSLFLDFIETQFQSLLQDRYWIFKDGRIVEIKNIQKQVLPILRLIILYMVEVSQGKLLTRAQANLGDRFKASLDHWTQPHIVSSESSFLDKILCWVDIGLYDKYLFPLLFDLIENGAEVEMNGKPFLVEENPFKIAFVIGHSEQSDANHWFDLDPQIFLNGRRVNPEELKFNFTPHQVSFVSYRGQMYRIEKKEIPSMRALRNFLIKITKGHLDTQKNPMGGEIYLLPKSRALELLLLKSQGIEITGGEEWKRVVDYFDHHLGIDQVQLPSSILKFLLPHQLEGVQWLHDLYELKLGAVLADEMGLGKTFQTLAFLMSLEQRQQLGRCLIVVPTSLVYNWIEEKKRFTPDLPFRIFRSGEIASIHIALKEAPVLIIATYGLLNENSDFFDQYDWNVVVFDEAQNLKNISSLRSISARKLRATFKVALTGTPMENQYLDFYSICDLILPGCLGDLNEFVTRYERRYDQGTDLAVVKEESLEELRLIAKPILLRRTKNQIKLSLPMKTIHQVLLPFSEIQKEIYKKMAATFSKQIENLIETEGEGKAQIVMFSALMRLRQICSDPAAISGVSYSEMPVKVVHFLESLQEHFEKQESIIVFTQFLSTLKRIEGELLKLNIPTFVLQGSLSAQTRLKVIDGFQKMSNPAVLLMTLKTGGVGLNLTKASVVYHLEPWWNPAVENQATDRAHRMGQTKDVKVYHLLIEGSLEERIADLKLRKQRSFDLLFGTDEITDPSLEGEVSKGDISGGNGLSREDFIHLLK